MLDRLLYAALVLPCSLPGSALVQESTRDPLRLYPENYRILFENEHVRVLDFRLAQGATETTHEHPRHVAVFLTDVRIRFTLPSGETRLREAKAGDVAYSEPTAHASENVGPADAHGVLIELRSGSGGELVAPRAIDADARGIAVPPGALTAVTLVHGLAGREADLREHLLSLSAPTRAEAGCLRYDLYQSTVAPHEFMRLEVWTSPAALEAHKETPHLRASFEKREREGWTTEIMTFQAAEPAPADSAAWIDRLDPRLDALIPRDAAVERVVDGNTWSEGPVWDARSEALYFSDVPRNVVMRWKQGEGTREFLAQSGYTGSAPFAGAEPGSNGLAFDGEGRLVLCQHGDRRIVRLERDGARTVLAERFEGRRLNSPNDLVFGPGGALYFTDPPFGLPLAFEDPAKELPFQGVFRLDAQGRLAALVRDLEAPNGLGFSPDGQTLYVSNAVNARPIWVAYEVRADGSLGTGRLFADASAYVEDGEGVPDGLEVDEHGNVFATGPGGVHVFAPDGTRLGRIVTGVKTGNVAFGGDGSELYVAAGHWILRLPTTTRGQGFARVP
jgi:gluconolactonase